MPTSFLQISDNSGRIMVSIKPDNLIFKDEIKFLFENEYLIIDNLIKFYSYRYPSRRVLSRIENILGSFVGKRTSLGVVSSFDISVYERTTSISISFSGAPKINHRAVMCFARKLFSSIINSIPEFAIREYNLLPLTESNYHLIVLLIPYNSNNKSTFEIVKTLIKGTVATLPNDSGDYFLSWYGIDNINSPPRILERIIHLLLDKNNLENSILTNKQNMALFIREVAKFADRIDDFTLVRELLTVIHNIFGGIPLEKDHVEKALKLLETLRQKYKDLGKLTDIYLHLQNLKDRLDLLEKLEEITIIRVILRRLSKLLNTNKKPLIGTLQHYFLAGTVIKSCKRKIIKLGGGKAIYLSPSEWKTIVGELNLKEGEELEIKIIKKADGTKTLVLEIID